MKLVKIEQDNCPNCRVMDVFLYALPDVEPAVQRVNVSREENKHYIKDYDIMAVPTLLILDDTGKELDRVVGTLGLNPSILAEKIDKYL